MASATSRRARAGWWPWPPAYYHSLALKADGRVVAWGANGHGQCSIPGGPEVEGLAVAAGAFHSLALKADGTVAAWGDNTVWPVHRPRARRTQQCAAGEQLYHSLALKADGTVAAWGANHYGQCTVPAEPERGDGGGRRRLPQPGPEGRRHRGRLGITT